MRLGEGVEWALHCATVLALLPPDVTLPGSRLAEFHEVPPAYLAKTLQALSRSGIVESASGRRGGYRLGRPAAEITLLDVVMAVEGAEPSFRCSEIRRRGPARVATRLYSPVCAIAEVMHRADAAWRAELNGVTVADLVGRLAATVHPDAAVKGAAWFQEVLS